MVAWAKREKIDASDIGIGSYQLRDLVEIIQENQKIETILFTGGNSKNGSEYFFRRNLKEYGLRLKSITTNIPRIHHFQLPEDGRVIKTASLLAPSAAAKRSTVILLLYKNLKNENPDLTAIDY